MATSGQGGTAVASLHGQVKPVPRREAHARGGGETKAENHVRRGDVHR